MNDSGYASFEEPNRNHKQAGAWGRGVHDRTNGVGLERIDYSHPATPISGREPKYPPGSLHTRKLSFDSTWGGNSSTASSPDGDVDVVSGSPSVSNVSPLQVNALPTPYLPLRKSSLNRFLPNIDTSTADKPFREGRSSPTPLRRESRRRNRSPPRLPRDRQPSPSLPDDVTTLDGIVPDTYPHPPILQVRGRARGYTSTSQVGHTPLPPLPQLKPSTSIPDLATSRRNLASSTYRPHRGPSTRLTNSSVRSREPPMPWYQEETRASYKSSVTNWSFMNEGEVRASFRSAFTNGSFLTYASSSYVDASETERSSVLTRASSFSDVFVKGRPTQSEDEGMSVEDAIAMYAAGFTDDIDDVEYIPYRPSPIPEEARSTPVQATTGGEHASQDLTIPHVPKSPSLPELSQSLPEPHLPRSVSPPPPFASSAKPPALDKQLPPVRTSDRLPSSPSLHWPRPAPTSPLRPAEPVPRDRYGFKKKTQYVTLEQYDSWDRGYSTYLSRRREKWCKLMKQEGLPVEKPERFPTRSDKVKRYVRKGIPPDWRGAAWFWYAGGPQRQMNEPGLYWMLVEQAEHGYLSDSDREHIERDLNRTFPDNIRFKPDVDDGQNESNPERPLETQVLRALRRVLQAFAINNPSIGYCQSLNFLAGLLLLFLDDEEKVFILLNIITTKHLPGTHAKVLEANIDVGVLMSCIKESMPAIWAKIDDNHDGPPAGLSTSRLPTVSLATTSWFMSLFIGTLPVECVLRVWDCFFFEGSKTLFRIALTIFKSGEHDIRAISDPMEVFQVVQQIPRRMIDANALMEACYKRRNGFGHLSQETVEKRRDERRGALKKDRARVNREVMGYESGEISGLDPQTDVARRAASRVRLRRAVSRKRGPDQ